MIHELYLGNSMNLNSIELCLNIDKDDYNENTRNHKIANSRWLVLVSTKGSHQQYKHPTKKAE